MKFILIFLQITIVLLASQISTYAQFEKSILTTGLDYPWEITFGPDGRIWTTERQGKRVTAVNPINGNKKTLVQINEVFFNPASFSRQDGLLGMALHPNLLKDTNEDFIYLAYTYSTNGSASGIKARIVRYTYDKSNDLLTTPQILINGLSANSDHNSGRLKFGPDNKLYYTIGDLGANQFNSKCQPIASQLLPSSSDVANMDYSLYKGKVLRINLDGSIPTDNPELNGVRSHIFTYGHRNAQGIVFNNEGILYSNEHGPKTDDEINILIGGKNYGWPHVAGYRDGKNYRYCRWASVSNCESTEYSDFRCPLGEGESEFSWNHPDFTAPIRTFYTVDDDYDFNNPPNGCGSSNFICWPSIAPSSIDLYESDNYTSTIPEWGNSLLNVSLKNGRVYRTKLSGNGKEIIEDSEELWDTQNRYRDIAISNDGITFYIATDSKGSTSGPSGGNTADLENPGAILAFKYVGELEELVLNNATLNLTENEFQKISYLYPNPVKSQLLLKTVKNITPTVTLHSTSGEIVRTLKFEKDSPITVSDLAQGIYFAKITAVNGSSFIQKILKK